MKRETFDWLQCVHLVLRKKIFGGNILTKIKYRYEFVKTGMKNGSRYKKLENAIVITDVKWNLKNWFIFGTRK